MCATTVEILGDDADALTVRCSSEVKEKSLFDWVGGMIREVVHGGLSVVGSLRRW